MGAVLRFNQQNYPSFVRMPHVIDEPNASSKSTSHSPARPRAVAAGEPGVEQGRARLVQDIAVEREGLRKMLADQAAQDRQIDEMATQLEALKQQGIQLVKQLKAAKQRAETHRQTVARVQQQIAAAEERLGGAASQDGPQLSASKQNDVFEPVLIQPGRKRAAASAPIARTGVISPEAHQGPRAASGSGLRLPAKATSGSNRTGIGNPLTARPARRPGEPSTENAAEEYEEYIEDSPLIGQLLQYQARQTRMGRARRIAVSLSLFILAVAAVVGFWILLRKMLSLDPLWHEWLFPQS